jgi:hypothetical protein
MSTYLTKSAGISWELVVNQRLATYYSVFIPSKSIQIRKGLNWRILI